MSMFPALPPLPPEPPSKSEVEGLIGKSIKFITTIRSFAGMFNKEGSGNVEDIEYNGDKVSSIKLHNVTLIDGKHEKEMTISFPPSKILEVGEFIIPTDTQTARPDTRTISTHIISTEGIIDFLNKTFPHTKHLHTTSNVKIAISKLSPSCRNEDGEYTCSQRMLISSVGNNKKSDLFEIHDKIMEEEREKGSLSDTSKGGRKTRKKSISKKKKKKSVKKSIKKINSKKKYKK